MPCEPRASALLASWERVLAERAEACAVHELAGSHRYSFAQLEAMAKSAENLLTAHGIRGGDTVLLALGNSAEWLAHYLALRRLNAVIVPMEPDSDARTTLSRSAAIVAALQARALIAAEGIFPLPPSAMQPPDCAGAPVSGTWPSGGSLPQSSICHTGDASHGHAGEFTYPASVANSALRKPVPSASPAANPAPDCAAFEPHLVKLTSGTTGQPRPLVFSEANMVADGRNIMATMGLRADSINFATLPLGHSYGLGNLVLPFFLEGVAIAFGTGIVPRELGRELEESRATFFPTVPTVLRALAAAGLPRRTFENVERIISAGSPLPPQVADAFFHAYGKRISNFYGASETGGICFDADGEATQEGRSVGTALANVRLHIADGGTVRVRSAAACHALCDAEGFLPLEDCGELRANGELVLLGRSGRSVKIGARRLNLGAWEASVRTLPGIEDAFACETPRANGETMLCAALQTALCAAEAKQLLRASLPLWQQPRRLLALDAFPLSERGKPDTALLRKRLGAQPEKAF